MNFEEIQSMQKEAYDCAQNLKNLDSLEPKTIVIMDDQGESVELNGEHVSLIVGKAKSVLKSRRDSLAREVRKANQDLMGSKRKKQKQEPITDPEQEEDQGFD